MNTVIWPALILLSAITSLECLANPTFVRVNSPNGQVRIELILQKFKEGESVPHWRVYFKNKPIVLASRLSIDLENGPSLGRSCLIESLAASSTREEYLVTAGKRHRVLNNFKESIVTLRERTAGGRRWELAIRAYDDGAAFRYRFLSQESWSRLVISAEKTEFALPDDAIAYTL